VTGSGVDSGFVATSASDLGSKASLPTLQAGGGIAVARGVSPGLVATSPDRWKQSGPRVGGIAVASGVRRGLVAGTASYSGEGRGGTATAAARTGVAKMLRKITWMTDMIILSERKSMARLIERIDERRVNGLC
jgi:hypothetical protein